MTKPPFTASYAPGEGPLGNATTPAPVSWQWMLGAAAGVLLHAAIAWPFLPKPEPAEIGPVEEVEGPEIGVRLAPIIQPPEQEAPPPEPEPEPETPVIEERAEDSPPPAPPKEPRKVPDLPDITPRAVPELWTGSGSAGDGGQMTLEEYLFLQDWLKAARKAVLERLGYPDEALRHMITGNAKVIIVADRSGKIVEWRFMHRTGSRILDQEIARTIRSIRRLPPFPEGTRYDTLSYVVTIRFELVRPDGTVMAAADIAQEQATRQQDAPDTLSTAHIAKCAAASVDLTRERDAIMAERERLEQLRTDYVEQAERYHRQRRQPPRRVENMREDYERGAESFDDRIAGFNQRADAYQSLCSGGSVTYEDYAAACRRYATTGNEYCAAYGNYWARLRAE